MHLGNKDKHEKFIQTQSEEVKWRQCSVHMAGAKWDLRAGGSLPEGIDKVSGM